MKAAKEVSAALLAGKNVGFYSEFPVEGKLPEGLVLCDEYGKPVRHAQDDILKDEESFGGCGDYAEIQAASWQMKQRQTAG